MVRIHRFCFGVSGIVAAPLIQVMNRRFYSLGPRKADGSVHYVDVVIEKMDTGTKGDEMKGDEMQPESETTSEGIPTPGTSVVDGQ